MIRFLRLGLVAAVSGALALLATVPAAAQSEQSVSWERYDVDVTLLPDATFQVVEEQEIEFTGTFRRGFREIPFRRLVSITEVTVEEPGRPYARGSNQDYTFSVNRDDNRLRVDWSFPPTSNARRTFILRYRVSGALRVYDAGDQIYWAAIYSDRAGPVRSGRVSVHLPADVTPAQTKLAGYPEAAVIEARLVDPRTALVATRNLPAESDFEVRLQIPHGLVAADPPPWQANADRLDWYDANGRPIVDLLALILGVAIASMGGFWLFSSWYARGRDPAADVRVGTLTEPPSDLPAAVVGTLVDEHADPKDALATIADLGRRGIVRVEPITSGGSVTDYRLRRLEERPAGLRPFEQSVLAAVTRGRQALRLSSLKNQFITRLPLIRAQLYEEVVREGLFEEDPDEVRKRSRVIGVAMLALAVPGFVIGLIVSELVAELVFFPFFVLGLLGVATLIAARSMPRRTRQGVVEAARWRAFGRGLATSVDAERTADNGHDVRGLLERYLPFAIALGVEKDWVARFDRLGVPVPSWYGGDGPVPTGPIDPSWAGSTASGIPGGSEGQRARDLPPSSGSSDAGAGGLQGGSDFLVQLLNSASEALSSGASSSGSDGGGWSGGGGGGGGGGSSGGGSGGFS